MILPAKHVSPERALLTVGGHILQSLSRPKTVSATWEDIRKRGRTLRSTASTLTYDQFVLALDLLYLIGAIDLTQGLLRRRAAQ